MFNSAISELTTYKYTPALIVKGNGSKQVPALKHPFLIPIYQRLYTWETEHVDRLLHDLFEAYKSKDSVICFCLKGSVDPLFILKNN